MLDDGDRLGLLVDGASEGDRLGMLEDGDLLGLLVNGDDDGD